MFKQILFMLVLMPAAASARLISLHTKNTRGGNPAQVIQESIDTQPTVVLFYKNYYTYCHFLRPLFHNIARTHDQLTCIELEMSHNDRLYKQAYNFTTVPQVLYFNDGAERHRHGSNNRNKRVNQMDPHVRTINHEQKRLKFFECLSIM